MKLLSKFKLAQDIGIEYLTLMVAFHNALTEKIKNVTLKGRVLAS